MIRLASARAPKTKKLAQQNTDFTAEGAPPPGKVATDVPATEHEPTGKPTGPTPAGVVVARKRPILGRVR